MDLLPILQEHANACCTLPGESRPGRSACTCLLSLIEVVADKASPASQSAATPPLGFGDGPTLITLSTKSTLLVPCSLVKRSDKEHEGAR